MKDTRIILSCAYNGDYQRCIQLLVENLEKQEKIIKELQDKVNKLTGEENVEG